MIAQFSCLLRLGIFPIRYPWKEMSFNTLPLCNVSIFGIVNGSSSYLKMVFNSLTIWNTYLSLIVQGLSPYQSRDSNSHQYKGLFKAWVPTRTGASFLSFFWCLTLTLLWIVHVLLVWRRAITVSGYFFFLFRHFIPVVCLFALVGSTL